MTRPGHNAAQAVITDLLREWAWCQSQQATWIAGDIVEDIVANSRRVSEVFSRQWWLSLLGMPKKASFSASENARIRPTNEIS
jgi:hypothetical protein